VQSVQTARDYVTQFDTQTRARFQQALTINLNVQKMMSQAMANLSPELRMASEGQQ
jgi:conjugative transfer pilus assembly protein TraH